MQNNNILFVAAELTPLAKVGGLADVVGALPKGLSAEGADVRIVIPKYGVIDESKYPLERLGEYSVPFKGVDEKVVLYSTPLPGTDVPIYLLDNQKYLGENGIYFDKAPQTDNPDREPERFTFFARASLSIFDVLEWFPDVIHCHDWHVGIVPALVTIRSKKDKRFEKVKTLFTIHNLEYQGWFDADTVLDALGLNASDHPAFSVQNKHKQISSLQQGILSADRLNTVSPAYAEEILTPEYGAGLEKDLNQKKDLLTGILNGIDVERFNPASDPALTQTYSSNDLSGKAACKEALQKKVGLPVDPNTPLIGIVSRLADQKGITLISDIADALGKETMQFVLLGTGDPKLEQAMTDFAAAFPEKVSANIEFNAEFAQQIYAGSDMFLMPSRYEPCGLGQMISMRYGTLPVVRTTGGLKDTVIDCTADPSQGTGFAFDAYDGNALLDAIQRGLKLYSDQKTWYTVVKRIMEIDFSWNNSARKYIDLYESL